MMLMKIVKLLSKLANRVPFIAWIMNKLIELIAFLAKRFDWIARLANRIMINIAVATCRTRPHPWSTIHSYVSWSSLTDQRWSARHLPEGDLPGFDAFRLNLLTSFFDRNGREQIMSEKSTCLFPAFAQYLTDGFIRTRMDHDDENPRVRLETTSNHQIDMSPLYGRTPEQTKVLRRAGVLQSDKGKLKSQMINGEEFPPYLYNSDFKIKPEFMDQDREILDPPLGRSKLAGQPNLLTVFACGGDRVNSAPQVAMINTLFLREHNRIAGVLASNNPTWDDERVFQTARSIIIVMFIKIVIEEYINHISLSPIPFRADPSVAWNATWNKPNWITAEFSLLYRWHSLIPDQIKWGGTGYSASSVLLNNAPLIQQGLLKSFVEISTQPSAAIGAFNTTNDLLPFEGGAINQAWTYKLKSYNDYREYNSMNRIAEFEEISSNPDVVKFMKTHYKSVDDIDFYIGLFAEDRLKNSPLPTLILRMVAVDAFSQALTNPLLSEHVFNAGTFTEWGMSQIESTSTLADILKRQYIGVMRSEDFVGMTQSGWHRQT